MILLQNVRFKGKDLMGIVENEEVKINYVGRRVLNKTITAVDDDALEIKLEKFLDTLHKENDAFYFIGEFKIEDINLNGDLRKVYFVYTRYDRK